MKGNNIAAQLREVTEGLEPTNAQALLRVVQKVSKETRAEKEAHLRYLLLKKKNQENAKKLREITAGVWRTTKTFPLTRNSYWALLVTL